MSVMSSTGRVLRFLAFLTVLGFLTAVLIGPVLTLVACLLGLVLTVAAFVLPFALIGLLVCAAYQVLANGPRAAWRSFRTRVGELGHWFVAVPLAACGRLIVWAAGAVRALAPVAVPVARRAGEAARDGVEKGVVLAGRGAEAAGAVVTRARSFGQVVGGVLLEVVGGAAVGTILVCLADSASHHGALALHITAGAIAGACLGLLVGAAKGSLRPERG
ncbi:MAG TPA: hypothetical protein VFW33_02625 [Gemmataceae bacterium]|nr:hypothetical protein [Gemmataceae bacterium]